ncbi:hypothetical protein [Rubrivivax gelatinosus]|nr:hypothetical protein [Rubrivivax gelatinosus]MBG6081224.1 hypothetical protein [Rubrivivax gelatinosus]
MAQVANEALTIHRPASSEFPADDVSMYRSEEYDKTREALYRASNVRR